MRQYPFYEKIKYARLLSILILVVGIGFIIMSISIDPMEDYAESEGRLDTVRIAKLASVKNRTHIVFGSSVSLTGKYHQEGHRLMEGYDLWAAYVNSQGGIKVGNDTFYVQIKYYDDHSRQEAVKENIAKLIVEDSVDFLLGPYSSALSLAASEVTKKHGRILMISSGASEVVYTSSNHLVFGVLTSATWYAREFFVMLREETTAPLSYAVIAMNKLFPRTVAKGVRIWAGEMGFEELYYEVVDNYQANLSGTIAEHSPDVIVFSGHAEDAAFFVRQLSQVKDYYPKAVLLTLGPTEKQFVELFDGQTEFLTGISQWEPEVKYTGKIFGTSANYSALFQKRYGYKPVYTNASASASGVVFQLAIEAANTLDAECILESIKTMDVSTFYGPISFDDRGMKMDHTMIVVQVQQGERRVVWPKGIAESKFVYPIE